MKGRFTLPERVRLTSAPALSVAFSGGRNSDLQVWDLKEGKIVKRYERADFDAKSIDFMSPAVSPDGKFLFALEQGGAIYRFRIAANEIKLEQTSPPVAADRPFRPFVSADSELLCVPCFNGNGKADDHPDIGFNHTYVYAVGNLRKPIIAIDHGTNPLLVEFDRKAGLYYGNSRDRELIVFNDKGKKIAEYPLVDGKEFRMVNQYLPHPEGKKLLVLCSLAGESRLWLIELGKGDGSRPTNLEPPPPKEELKPVAANDVVGGQPRMVDDLKVVEVKTAGVSQTPGVAAWTADGKAFLHAQPNRVLRRVRLDGFCEERRMNLGTPPVHMSMSAQGALLTMLDKREVWLIDPETLKVRARLPIGSASRVVSAPGLSLAFAGSAQNQITVLRLPDGKVLKQYSGDDLGRGAGRVFNEIEVSPDGRSLFVIAGEGSIARLSIADDGGLKLEQSSLATALQPRGLINVSPDGQRVCVPSIRRIVPPPKDYPEGPNGTAYVYDPADLTRPVFTLALGQGSRSVAFDVKKGLIYSHKFGAEFMVFDAKGKKVKDYQLAERGRFVSVWQMLAHPDGGKALIFGIGSDETKIWFVELPAK